ncbi:MAG: hypothetical protein ACH0QD_14100, partial [Tepidibacillus sp.]
VCPFFGEIAFSGKMPASKSENAAVFPIDIEEILWRQPTKKSTSQKAHSKNLLTNVEKHFKI